MKTSDKLFYTTNYSMFDTHEYNRPIREKKKLDDSFQKAGKFIKGQAITVVKNGNGKFKVTSGHHRLYYAQKYKYGVWYIVDDDVSNPSILQGHPWSGPDYIEYYIKQGVKDYQDLAAFIEQYDLPYGVASKLLTGRSASDAGGEITNSVKDGTYKIGPLISHAKQVVQITELCRQLKLPFAVKSSFVTAASMALRIPELSIKNLISKIKAHHPMMKNRAETQEFLQEIENVYNRFLSPDDKLPIQLRANAVMKQRQGNFRKKK